MDLTLVFSLASLESQFQICVFFLKDVSGCQYAQVVLKTGGQVFPQFQIQKHYLINTNFSVRQINHVDLLDTPSKILSRLITAILHLAVRFILIKNIISIITIFIA